MNNKGKFTTIRELADRVTRHPLMSELTMDTFVHYAVDFITILGLPTTYLQKSEQYEIDNYRTLLPCNLINIKDVRLDSTGESLRASTNVHIANKHKGYLDDNYEKTFHQKGNVLYTSFKAGKITVLYDAMPVDNMGFPLLPDDPMFLNTLELYIKKQHFTILMDLGKISQQALHNAQQEYSFRVGQLRTSYVMPTVAEMESISNMMNQLLPRTNEFVKGFSTLGNREYIKRH